MVNDRLEGLQFLWLSFEIYYVLSSIPFSLQRLVFSFISFLFLFYSSINNIFWEFLSLGWYYLSLSFLWTFLSSSFLVTNLISFSVNLCYSLLVSSLGLPLYPLHSILFSFFILVSFGLFSFHPLILWAAVNLSFSFIFLFSLSILSSLYILFSFPSSFLFPLVFSLKSIMFCPLFPFLFRDLSFHSFHFSFSFTLLSIISFGNSCLLADIIFLFHSSELFFLLHSWLLISFPSLLISVILCWSLLWVYLFILYILFSFPSSFLFPLVFSLFIR